LLASIGRRTGVARIFGFNFSGFFAWWLWRTLYLSKLPGFDKKVRVAFDWTLDLLFRKDVCAVHEFQACGASHDESASRTIPRSMRPAPTSFIKNLQLEMSCPKDSSIVQE
jgi:hypothetical protein